ncbi:unnamed protein product [Rangifer tarandus platyrhynchus]|uniref:Uncharacterized protein n=2 Tax=Rangifer tarandus platyrhynchus TaxID=3082113 RepID=A0AC59ZCJ9_RANTA|nr:unnamed protein product [Rangifer tarandus platyrhynchus]
MSNIVFLVEGQQGARREKSNTSHLRIPELRSPSEQGSVCFALQPHLLSQDLTARLQTGRRKPLPWEVGPAPPLPSHSLLRGKESAAPLHLQARCISPRQTASPMTEWRTGRSCDVSCAEPGPSFPFPSPVTGLRVLVLLSRVSPCASRGGGVEVADGR